MSRHTRYFTLVELLAVIAIITILAGMIIGGVAVAMRKASEAKTRGQMHQLDLALEQYRQAFGYLPPLPRDTGQPQKMREYFIKGTTALNVRYHGLEQPNTAAPLLPGKYLVEVSSFEFSGGYTVDGFGNSYYYQCPGTMNPQSYDLWSMGVDGLHGGNPSLAAYAACENATTSCNNAACANNHKQASTVPARAMVSADNDDLTNWKK